MTTTELSDCVAIEQRPQAPPYQIVARLLPVWRCASPLGTFTCAPRLGTLTIAWSVGAHFFGESAFRAKISGIGTYGIFLKTHGYLYQQRGKEHWVAAVIMGDRRYRKLEPGLVVTKRFAGWVNDELKKDPHYCLGEISPKTIKRTLKRLRELKAQGAYEKLYDELKARGEL
jgi:hypothetical protein